MKRLLTLISVILISAFSVHAQANFSDSVAVLLNQIYMNGQELKNVDKFYDLGHAYSQTGDYDKAIKAYNNSLSISEKFDETEWKIKNHYQLGVTYKKHEKLPNSIEHFKIVIDLEHFNDHKTHTNKVFYELGSIYFALTNYPKAKEYFSKSYSFASEINDQESMAETSSQLAVIYDMQGKLDSALLYYTSSLKLFKEQENFKEIAYTYNNLGLYFNSTGELDKAISYLRKSLDLKLQIQDTIGALDTYSNLGVMYAINNNDSSLIYFQKAYLVYKKTNDKVGIGKSLNNIGNVYMNKENYPKALRYFTESLEVKKEVNDQIGQVSSYLNLGELYLINEQNKIALNCFLEAAEISDSTKHINNQIASYQSLFNFYESQGQYKEAFEYYKVFSALQEDRMSVEKLEQISRLQLNFDLEIKQEQLNIMQTQAETEQMKVTYMKIGIAGVFIIALGIGFLIFLLLRQQKIKTVAKNTDLKQKLLRLQMNPHFIYNSLTAIHSFIFERDSLNAGEYLSDFAKLFRKILENSNKEFILLDDEIKTLTHYIKLQQMRFGNKFDFEI